MAKHFSMVKKDQLPSRQDPDYPPLQNISAGVDVLKTNSVALWKSGSTHCIDEGRVRSKGNRNLFRIFNPEKPIKMGWTVLKLGEQGQFGGCKITNHLVKVRRKTYTSTARSKTYNIVNLFLSFHKGNGKIVALDNGFPTIKRLEDATRKGKTAHFPSRHRKFMKQAKYFACGFSKSLHMEPLQ